MPFVSCRRTCRTSAHHHRDDRRHKSTTAIPAGPDILVAVGQAVQADQPLTNNPNVGGFGQGETEIVLQNPARLQGATDFELGHYFDPSWDIETINRVLEHMSLAFLDCHVKGDSARCDYLPARNDSQQYEGSLHQHRDPWPGFKHLWASGLEFYRK